MSVSIQSKMKFVGLQYRLRNTDDQETQYRPGETCHNAIANSCCLSLRFAAKHISTVNSMVLNILLESALMGSEDQTLSK